MQNPTIVVSTYSRLKSLKRLLKSLKQSNYFGYENVRLIISVDKHSTKEEDILEYLNDFEWQFGEFIIKTYKERQGLKNHFITCCDFSLEYDAVIFLEDDFLVSKSFYQYGRRAINFYEDDDRIAGICLYDLNINEFSNRLFSPLLDNNEQYFMQLPSWGKIFTKRKWQSFKKWYLSDNVQNSSIVFPKVLQKWSDHSFKKEYIKYLVLNDKFFVFPRKSFVTNYGDPGQHFIQNDSKFQRPIRVDNKNIENFRFTSLNDSLSVYDMFMEILPEKLKKLNTTLKNYNFTVDLYGIKHRSTIDTPYVLTSKKVKNPILTFGRFTVPHETNIIFNNAGTIFSLVKTKDVIKRYKGFNRYFLDGLYDCQGVSPFKLLLIDFWNSIINIKYFFKKDSFKYFFKKQSNNKNV